MFLIKIKVDLTVVPRLETVRLSSRPARFAPFGFWKGQLKICTLPNLGFAPNSPWIMAFPRECSFSSIGGLNSSLVQPQAPCLV
jgi:hypothetical protein